MENSTKSCVSTLEFYKHEQKNTVKAGMSFLNIPPLKVKIYLPFLENYGKLNDNLEIRNLTC